MTTTTEFRLTMIGLQLLVLVLRSWGRGRGLTDTLSLDSSSYAGGDGALRGCSRPVVGDDAEVVVARAAMSRCGVLAR